MAIGKSLRFEIFARDSFTCQYCGNQPPKVVLEVDHIHPVSKGGTDEVLNLITACFDCPRPDADLKFLQVQQEAAEVKRYLKAKKTLDAVNVQACESLQDSWELHISKEVPRDSIILPWLKQYGPAEIEMAIMIAARRWGYAATTGPELWKLNKAIPWVGGILRNRRNEGKSA